MGKKVTSQETVYVSSRKEQLNSCTEILGIMVLTVKEAKYEKRESIRLDLGGIVVNRSRHIYVWK